MPPAPAQSPPAAGAERDGDLVCHCRKVPYSRVRTVIDAGQARSLADVQRTTTACTRCFGCRFELEGMLRDRLGDDYHRTAFVARPDEEPGSLRARVARLLGRTAAPPEPKRMYMPVLHGLHGDVRTRVVLFHWHEEGPAPEPIDVRADLLALDGTRLDVWHTRVGPGASAVLEVADLEGAARLTDGVGTLKLVLDAERVGSLRPYFHLITPGGVTSTHEKSSPKDPRTATTQRGYHWTFPVGAGPRRSHAYFYAVNAVFDPIRERELVWCPATGGPQASVALPELELDQGVLVPLHEHFPAIGAGGVGGSVRLTPTTHVAGHILRYDPEADLWRVQHL